eukprot:3152140-Pyramimonas_sp.AAC.1
MVDRMTQFNHFSPASEKPGGRRVNEREEEEYEAEGKATTTQKRREDNAGKGKGWEATDRTNKTEKNKRQKKKWPLGPPPGRLAGAAPGCRVWPLENGTYIDRSK